MEFSTRVLKSREDIFHQHLSNMSDGSFSDVTFVIGEVNAKICGVRSTLAAISPVFKAMLYGKMQESTIGSVIRIPDCCPQAFQCIIKYSHGIDPKINLENCFQVRYVIEKYQITPLASHVDNFISESIDQENFCALLNATVQLSNSTLTKKIVGILKELDSMLVLSSETFVHSISVASLITLLESEEFQVPEEYLWERCLQWANHQACISTAKGKPGSDELKNERKKFLSQIQRYIRFPIMTLSYIMSKVQPLNLLDDSDLTAVLADIAARPYGAGPWSTFSAASRIKTEEKEWEKWAKYLTVGSMIDAKDGNNWCAAKILQKDEQFLEVHYHGWGDQFNAKLAYSPATIQPVYTKTSNLVLQFRKGLEVDVLHVIDGLRQWFPYQILEVDAAARKMLVLPAHLVGRLENKEKNDLNSKWVDMDSEEITSNLHRKSTKHKKT